MDAGGAGSRAIAVTKWPLPDTTRTPFGAYRTPFSAWRTWLFRGGAHGRLAMYEAGVRLQRQTENWMTGEHRPAKRNGEPQLPSGALADDELLSPQRAARIAERSVRTIRRAYQSGRLLAYRDGNGQRIGIRCGDLRRWLLAASVVAPPHDSHGGETQTPEPLRRLEMRGRLPTRRLSENLALLRAARARRQHDDAPGDDGQPRAEGSAARGA
jgi:hypothetical protein